MATFNHAPLKIALVCDWYLPRIGGIESHLKELGTRLTRKGHDVHVITPIPGTKKTGDLKIIRISTPLLPYFNVMISKKGILSLEAVLKSEKYDLVHCHFSYISPFAFAGLCLMKKHHIPGMITFHSFLGEFTRVLRLMDRITGWARWPFVFSAVSDRISMEVRQAGVSGEIETLPNGIDPQYWAVPRKHPDPAHIQLVSVMRLTMRKRPLHLIKIMHGIRKKIHGHIFWKLIIIGKGFEYTKMRRLIKKLDLGSHIILMGALPQEKIKQVFSQSDIFVLPSILESFGIAALEARCAGLPVVAMGHGGIRSFIRHGKEGLLADNDMDMGVKLLELINDDKRLRQISIHNRSHPCPLTWKKVLAEHERLYYKSMALLNGPERSL